REALSVRRPWAPPDTAPWCPRRLGGDQVRLPRHRGAGRGDPDEDGGAGGARVALGMHADLLRQPVALLAVAGSTRGDDVLPYRLAATAPGDDVVDGQARLAGTAVLTGPAVAGEHSLAGDPAAVDVARDADEGDQPDHLGPVDPHRLGAKHAFAVLKHLCLLLQDQDQRPSNGAHVERLIA